MLSSVREWFLQEVEAWKRWDFKKHFPLIYKASKERSWSSTVLPQNVENQRPPVQVLQRGEPCKGETNIMRRFGNLWELRALSSLLFTSLIPCWLPRRLTGGIVNISTVHFRGTNPTKLALELLVSAPLWGSSLKCCGWFYMPCWRAIKIFFKKNVYILWKAVV